MIKNGGKPKKFKSALDVLSETAVSQYFSLYVIHIFENLDLTPLILGNVTSGTMLIIAGHLFLHINYISQGMLTSCSYNVFLKIR